MYPGASNILHRAHQTASAYGSNRSCNVRCAFEADIVRAADNFLRGEVTYFLVRRSGSSEILGRCFAQKCGERCRILLAGGEILGEALVEFRSAFIKLARGR